MGKGMGHRMPSIQLKDAHRDPVHASPPLLFKHGRSPTEPFDSGAVLEENSASRRHNTETLKTHSHSLSSAFNGSPEWNDKHDLPAKNTPSPLPVEDNKKSSNIDFVSQMCGLTLLVYKFSHPGFVGKDKNDALEPCRGYGELQSYSTLGIDGGWGGGTCDGPWSMETEEPFVIQVDDSIKKTVHVFSKR